MIDVTLRDCAEQKLSLQMPDIKESTYEKYRHIYDRYILPEFGSLSPENISTEKIEKFKQKLIYEYRLSNRSVRDILIMLGSLLRYVSLLYPSYKPVKIIYPREQKKEMRIMSDMEIRIFTNHLLSSLNPCTFGILLSLYSGIRIGEISALRWRNIDLKENNISIENTLQRVSLSDSPDGRKTTVIIGKPKTASSIRLIPIHDDIYGICRLMKSDDDNFVLTASTRYMEPRSLQNQLKKHLDACGITDVHFHTLRHTFASKCVEAGVEIKVLSEILGHSKTSITFDRYVHTTMDFKRKNINKVSFI